MSGTVNQVAPPPLVAPTAAPAMPQNLAMFGQAAQQPVQPGAMPGSDYLATILQALHSQRAPAMGQQTIPNPQTWTPPMAPVQQAPVSNLGQLQVAPLKPPTQAEQWRQIFTALFGNQGAQ